MLLTGLELTLIGGAIATGSTLITVIANLSVNKRKEKYLLSVSAFKAQKTVCTAKFERDEEEREKANKSIERMNKMFIRFITYSDLNKVVKAKILNGDH